MFFLQVLRFELLLQSRSLRFRFGAVVCLLAACFGPVGVYFLVQPQSSMAFGSGAYFKLMLDGLRFPSVILAILVAGNRADLEGSREMWSVLGSAGIHNVGVLLYRSLAQIVLVAGLTLVPLLTTIGLVLRAGLSGIDFQGLAWSWLLLVLPAVVLTVLTWGALVQITGTELGSLMVLLLGHWALTYVADKLQPWIGVKLVFSSQMLGFRPFQDLVYRAVWILRYPDHTHFYAEYWASDVPVALSLEWGARGTDPVLFAGLAALFFSVATFFLRRTRSNLEPLVLRQDHPLRNLLRYVHGFRQRYAPDGGLFWERWVLVLGLSCLVAALLFLRLREHRFTSFAEGQYAARTELEGFPPTPPRLQLENWELTGRLAAEGIEIRAIGRLRHLGEEPVSRLSFGLNPFLTAVAELEGRSVEVERSWDRLALKFEPRLEPGDEARLEFRVQGRPRRVDFEMYGPGDHSSFVTRYRQWIKGAPASEKNQLSRSWLEDRVSRRGIALAAEDLAPVLRYGTWELTPPPDTPFDRGSEVPDPKSFPLLDLQVDLAVEEGFSAVDACGLSSAPAGRMEGSCRLALSRYRIEGGLHRVVRDDGILVAASLPGHEDLLARQLETVQEVVALSAEVWDGVEPLDRLAVVEQPLLADAFRIPQTKLFEGGRFKTFGKLLVLRETAVVEEEPLAAELLVGAVMAGELLRRRSLEPFQERVFQGFFAALMARRMSTDSRRRGAILTGKPWQESQARLPVLELEEYRSFVFERKVPALLVYLESLVGSESLYAGIETFLARETDSPGTIEELIADVEGASGVSLESYYHQLLAGRGLPKLRLEQVESVTEPDGRYRVTGLLKNLGDGEVRCPIVAKGETQVIRRLVTVGPQDATPFEFQFDAVPFSVQLDPEDVCFRWVSRGRMIAERVSLVTES